MEAAPSAALEMSEPHLLLEFLIVALDAPAQLGKVHQAMEGDAFGKGREPVFGRLLLAFGPLDQQPLFRSALAAQREHAHEQSARTGPRRCLGAIRSCAKRAWANRTRVPGPRPVDARRHAARALVVGRGPTTFLAAAALCRGPTRWCSTECRRRKSTPAL